VGSRCSGAENLEPIPAIMAEDSLGHLGPARILRAKDENPLFHRSAFLRWDNMGRL
jgi:hypothetical protein